MQAEDLSTPEADDKAVSRVSLRRSGQFLLVAPPCAEALAHLRAVRVVAGPSANGHGYRAEPVSWEMFTRMGLRVDGRGDATELACWAGLGPAVRRLLARAGRDVVDLVPAPAFLPAPNQSLLKKINTIDVPLLGLVRRHDRALISYDSAAVAPDQLLAQVALAWPELSVTVAVKRTAEAYWLARRLCPYLPDVERYHTDHRPWRPSRIAIATYDFLDHGPISLFERDIVVVFNAREGASPGAQQQLARAVRARLYGLLPLGEEPSPFERDQFVKLYGFEHLFIPAHGKRVRTVRSLFLRATGKVALPDKAGLTERLRRAVWENPVRNRRVARLARLLAANEGQPLRRQSPAVAAALGGRTVRGVVVLADGVEHALALARQVPGWAVLTGLDRCLDGLSAGQRQALSNNAVLFPSDTPTVIATGDGVAYVPLSAVDVVVRADAGVGLPPLPAESLVEAADAAHRPLLLVDHLDRDDPVLKRHARRRQAAYAEAGWLGPGVDPVQARVEAFLAARG